MNFFFASPESELTHLCAAIGAAGLGSIPLVFQQLFADMLNSFAYDAAPKQRETLAKVSLNLLFVAIGAGVASCIHNCCVEIAYENVGVRLKADYFSAVAKQEIGEYFPFPSPLLISYYYLLLLFFLFFPSISHHHGRLL